MKLIPAKKLSQWRRIHKLYKSAFPKYERKPFQLILFAHKKAMADVWVIESSGAFSGFAITMNAKDMVLLDYFAVSEEMRGKGIGAEALRTLQNYYKGNRLFLEIESVYAEAENIAERKRRKKFYLANGMTEMKVMVSVFGTDMELLGYDCIVNFNEYQSLYRINYGEWAARNLIEQDYPSI